MASFKNAVYSCLLNIDEQIAGIYQKRTNAAPVADGSPTLKQIFKEYYRSDYWSSEDEEEVAQAAAAKKPAAVVANNPAAQQKKKERSSGSNGSDSVEEPATGTFENLMNGSGCDVDWVWTPLCLIPLNYRTVSIGSDKVVKVDRVNITIQEISIHILPEEIAYSSFRVCIHIPWDRIVKILAHFGEGMPVLFLYTTTSMAAEIKKKVANLAVTKKDESQRWITLLLENIPVESSSLLKKLFENLETTEYVELSQNEANDILARVSPKEVQNQVQRAAVNTSRLTNDTPPSLLNEHENVKAEPVVPHLWIENQIDEIMNEDENVMAEPDVPYLYYPPIENQIDEITKQEDGEPMATAELVEGMERSKRKKKKHRAGKRFRRVLDEDGVWRRKRFRTKQ